MKPVFFHALKTEEKLMNCGCITLLLPFPILSTSFSNCYRNAKMQFLKGYPYHIFGLSFFSSRNQHKNFHALFF